jgi:hypothetical protein
LFSEYLVNKINNLALENKDINEFYFTEGIKNNITSNSINEYRNFLYNEILNQIPTPKKI